MIEVDRILRPCGYWILFGPPIRWAKYWKGWERSEEDLKQEQDTIEDFAKRMCWKRVDERGDIVVWQKPVNHIECVKNRKTYKKPHMCKSEKLMQLGRKTWKLASLPFQRQKRQMR